MSLVHRVLHTHANLLSGTLVYPSPCLVPHGQLLHACIHFELSCSGSDELHLQVKRVLEIWHCMAFYPPPPPKPLLDSYIERCSVGSDKLHALD